MRSLALACSLITFFNYQITAQVTVAPTGLPARYQASVFRTDGSVIQGVLPRVTDSAVFIYGGKFSEWKQKNIFPVTMERYQDIQKMYVRRRDKVRIGLGIAVGAAAGAITSLLSTASATYYMDEQIINRVLVFIPVGALVGGVVGFLTKRTFVIDGDQANFLRFRKKVKTFSLD